MGLSINSSILQLCKIQKRVHVMQISTKTIMHVTHYFLEMDLELDCSNWVHIKLGYWLEKAQNDHVVTVLHAELVAYIWIWIILWLDNLKEEGFKFGPDPDISRTLCVNTHVLLQPLIFFSTYHFSLSFFRVFQGGTKDHSHLGEMVCESNLSQYK